MKRREFVKSAMAGAGLLASGILPAAAKAATSGKEKNGANFKKIDAFCHLVPDEYFKWLADQGIPNSIGFYVKATPEHHLIEPRLKMMDDCGIQTSVIFPQPELESLGESYGKLAPAAANKVNSCMAAVCEKYPRFKFAALLPLTSEVDVEKAFNDALSMPGMVGVGVLTSPMTRPPDDPMYQKVYALAAPRNVPVWVHLSRGANLADFKEPPSPGLPFPVSQNFIWVILGYLLDGSAAMTRIVFADIFRKYPGVKIVMHQRGHLIPLYKDRIKMHYDLFKNVFPKPVGIDPETDTNYIMEQFKKFYVDTVCNGIDTDLLTRSVNFFGADKVMYATDAAFSLNGGRFAAQMSRDTVLGLQVSDKDLENIFAGNIMRLMEAIKR